MHSIYLPNFMKIDSSRQTVILYTDLESYFRIWSIHIFEFTISKVCVVYFSLFLVKHVMIPEHQRMILKITSAREFRGAGMPDINSGRKLKPAVPLFRGNKYGLERRLYHNKDTSKETT